MNAHKFVAGNGIEKATRVLNESPSNAQSYQDGYYFRTTPEFLFHNGHHHWNMTTNNGQYFKDRGFDPILISELKQVVESVNKINDFGGIGLANLIDQSTYGENLDLDLAIADYKLVQAYKNGDA
ncbi:hypothetical protein [Acinetobacter soli]|uniref:Uncharacterized protein n=1 Tax=Acinetobacter soli TaxID=487316 RepID=A0A1P8EFQ8_9GAMM|nr:hypothetical protein [Acinetobacter soli]APV35043.1 hypothetical protein BEN76_02995 [Acinetobacter soli]WND05604.1 hypothetical protein RHP80_00040 [Acinetobacter soli]